MNSANVNGDRTKRVAVVTGAARGIGKAIAEALAEKGHIAVVTDIDADSARETSEYISGLGGDTAYYCVDVSDVKSISSVFKKISKDHGSIDILVNNAGILSTTEIADLTEVEWDRVLAINLKGAVFATQQAVKYMITGGWGRVVNISSMAARMGGFSTGCAYTASKAALLGITMRIAREVADKHITVNAIAPGTANTEMLLGFTEAARKALKASIPVGKLVEPADIGETVAFLASDAAGSITGSVIDINGGVYMG